MNSHPPNLGFPIVGITGVSHHICPIFFNTKINQLKEKVSTGYEEEIKSMLPSGEVNLTALSVCMASIQLAL
jgi:hypothetical protein